MWSLGQREALAVWTLYVDDFPTLAPSNIAKACKAFTELLLRLLGREYSDDPLKDPSFAASFAALGVQYDLSTMTSRQHCFEQGLTHQGCQLYDG